MGEVEQFIRDLFGNNFSDFARSNIDIYADKLSELSDSEVCDDDIRDMIAALARDSVISKKDSLLLYSKYLDEKS